MESSHDEEPACLSSLRSSLSVWRLATTGAVVCPTGRSHDVELVAVFQ